MTRFFNRLQVYRTVCVSCIGAVLALLPDENVFYRLRLRFWRARGYNFGAKCCISRGVHFTGKVVLGENAIISPNCFFSGMTEGINVGSNVMFGPNCILVAFNHGFSDLEVPMVNQPNVCAR